MDRLPGSKSHSRGATYLSLIVAHLNASTGPVLSEAQLELALQTGSVHGRADDLDGGDALIASLFVEVEPRLIVLTARELGISEGQIEALYQSTLSQGAP